MTGQKTDRHELLKNWIYTVLIDHKEVITDSNNAEQVYSQLFPIWLEDCQKAMKEIILESNVKDQVMQITKEANLPDN